MLGSDLVRILQRAEAAICAQISLSTKRTSFDQPSAAALDTEVRSYEHVDALCRDVAIVLTQWLQPDGTRVRLVVHPDYCEAILFRVRDAIQLLADVRRVPPEFDVRTDRLFEQLLVSRWHSYAEHYCTQRHSGEPYQRPAIRFDP